MREASDDIEEYLTQPHGVGTRIRCIYDGNVIADDIPIVSGTVIGSSDQAVPERLTIEVPVRDRDGTIWEPVDPGDPLNNFGQRLEVTYLIPRSGELADIEVLIGQYRIQDWDASRSVVSVEATGLEQVIIDARLVVPSSPAAGMTYVTALEFLMEDILPLEIDSTIDDDPISTLTQWERDRYKAITDILDVWDVRGFVSPEGVFIVVPKLDIEGAPLMTWYDGENGTVVSAPRGGSRDGIYNAVIARSSSTDLSDYEQMVAQASAYDSRATSPLRWDGPFGNVPYFFASPLIKTAAAALKSANTILQRVTRFASSREITAVPDPRPQLGDIAAVQTIEHAGPTLLSGELIRYRLPLTAAQGAASYTVSTTGVIGVEPSL